MSDLVTGFGAIIGRITERLRALEQNVRSEVSGGVQALPFASLPPAGQPGRLRFVTDGCKVGEGPGAGTGVICYDDGSAWETCDTSTPVAV